MTINQFILKYKPLYLAVLKNTESRQQARDAVRYMAKMEGDL